MQDKNFRRDGGRDLVLAITGLDILKLLPVQEVYEHFKTESGIDQGAATHECVDGKQECDISFICALFDEFVRTGCKHGSETLHVCLMGLLDEVLKVDVEDVLDRESSTQDIELERQVLVASL